MFFGQQENLDISTYIKEEWASMPEFCDKLNESAELLLQGYGFAQYEQDGQDGKEAEQLAFHIVRINDRMFGFCGDTNNLQDVNENSGLNYKKIVEFDNSVLSSSLFEANQFRFSKNLYKRFDAELVIEAKLYSYNDEQRILISKKGQGNIDLYFAYSIKNKTNELFGKVYPSVFNAVKHLAMKKLLDERINNRKKEE